MWTVPAAGHAHPAITEVCSLVFVFVRIRVRVATLQPFAVAGRLVAEAAAGGLRGPAPRRVAWLHQFEQHPPYFTASIIAGHRMGLAYRQHTTPF